MGEVGPVASYASLRNAFDDLTTATYPNVFLVLCLEFDYE